MSGQRLERTSGVGRRMARVRTAGMMIAATSALVFTAAPFALASGDANEAACPSATETSPGFRSYLPDCRAYELVSPSFSDGSRAIQIGRSVDGSRVLIESLGVFANTENDNVINAHVGSLYELDRTNAGWQTKSLDPPASEFPAVHGVAFWPAGFGAELQSTLWSLSTETEEAEGEEPKNASFYIREASGNFARIGPERHEGATAYPNVLGASADLSQIVLRFKVNAEEAEHAHPRSALWPGDGTIGYRPSLYSYEYNGVPQQEPLLVGVSNEGALASNTEAKLISQCGTALGSAAEAGDLYNAISETGSAIYFTAARGGCEEDDETGAGPTVNELYARVDGARTVPISEPSLSVPGRSCTGICREDEQEEATGKRSAGVFQGASRNGTKAFFLTEQPLVNADLDKTKDLYMAELGVGTAGEPATVRRLIMVSEGETHAASSENDPTPGDKAEVQGVARVSEDGSRVYFVAKGVLTLAPGPDDHVARANADNLYVYDTETGVTSFVATLSRSDSADWKAADSRPVQASANGEFLVFPSTSALTPDDHSQGLQQLFEYDAATGALARVSIGHKDGGTYLCPTSGEYEEGYNCNGNITESEYAPSLKTLPYSSTDAANEEIHDLAVAEDGAVVFASKDALTPEAATGYPNSETSAPNVYEYTNGNVFQISDGRDATLSFTSLYTPDEFAVTASGIDPSGEDIFFTSADSLIAGEAGTQIRLYDARDKGGFPEPLQSAGCGGAESCQGSQETAGYEEAAASAIAPPGGNVPPIKSAQSKSAKSKASKRSSRAKKLGLALKACQKKSKRRRASCEKAARKRYGANIENVRSGEPRDVGGERRR